VEDYLIGIGKRIKKIRKEKQLTISEVASRANVSNGLISRIENGRTIPSLPVLLSLIASLDTPVSIFFENLDPENNVKFIVARHDEYTDLEKEIEAEGFTYKFIFSKQLTSMGFEAVLLEVKPNSKREKVITDAFEFKYILSGEITYLIDKEEVILREGDSLFFDGRIPHVPVNKGTSSCKMLVLYFFIKDKEN
jgi:transcriptional regulator with XRE-family HTH domain